MGWSLNKLILSFLCVFQTVHYNCILKNRVKNSEANRFSLNQQYTSHVNWSLNATNVTKRCRIRSRDTKVKGRVACQYRQTMSRYRNTRWNITECWQAHQNGGVRLWFALTTTPSQPLAWITQLKKRQSCLSTATSATIILSTMRT